MMTAVPHLPTVDSGAAAMRQRFISRVRSLDSTLEEVADIGAVPVAAAAYLASQGLPPALVGWPEFDALPWRAAGLDWASRPVNSHDAVGLTGAFCGIAETGTLMLVAGPGEPATTSLLPETHIAVVDAAHVVLNMEAAFALHCEERGVLPHTVNFVSGPSRTGDIELTLVLGAHGPCRVHVLLLGGVHN